MEDTVQYEKKFGERLAPLLVEQCVNFIRERGLDEEGLFRMPGQANLVKELQDAFDCGEKPQFDWYRFLDQHLSLLFIVIHLGCHKIKRYGQCYIQALKPITAILLTDILVILTI